MAERLRHLLELGQSVWLDFIRRDHLLSGEFDRLIERGVVGVTSNPTIFQQAISHGGAYDSQIAALHPSGIGTPALFETLAIEDIRTACDHLTAVFESTGGRDGRVSIEVAPTLAHDTRATLDEARRLHRAVARPNLMVKIPATVEGLAAITAATAEGISINVTLIFSLARHRQVMDAYLGGLEQRLAADLPVDAIHSVASFFVSRVDGKVDPAIEAAIAGLPAGDPRRAELESMRGRAAIANARLAYAQFRETFAAPQFAALAARGAQLQRPLWASTSTKNPAYRDTLYVDELIGRDTVDTMPPQTIEAFDDHGALENRIDHDLDGARTLMRRLTELGVPVDALIDQLEAEGVTAFAKSYTQLLQALEEKRHAFGARPPAETLDAIPVAAATLARLERDRFLERLWAKDGSLWTDDSAHHAVARQRLGWLESPAAMRAEIGALERFARELATEGFTHAVLLGMGGSSLAPEVLRRTFGVAAGALDLTVLDSTSPAAVRAVAEAHDPARTLFIVSSKSGGTIEVASFEKTFFARVSQALGDKAGRSFVAITDPGSPLEALARTRGYRHTFLNPPDIGGRYSALSYFGLVPAALIGAPLGALVDRALDELRVSAANAPVALCPGVRLGAALGDLALAGRDKLTLVVGEDLAAAGVWIEQLVAESTGKQNKGIVPVVDEPLGRPEAYGNDRVFAAFSAGRPPHATEPALVDLANAGHPVLRWSEPDPAAIGAEFVRWEIATVTAAALLGIDPFDEPNVTEAKQATQAVLDHVLAGGSLPRANVVSLGGIDVSAPPVLVDRLKQRLNGRADPAAWASALIALAQPGDYFAALAYFHRTPERHARLERLATAVRSSARIATTIGYGPRFLHSTGQLHKGGPPTGLFLQLLADDGDDVPIPGERYGFATLNAAQALGDYQVLEKRGRRVLRLALGAHPERALEEITEAVAAAHV